MSTIEKEWLTVEQFRRRHNLGKNLVYEAVRDNRLPGLKLGGKILIPSDALDQLIQKRSETLNS